MSRPEQSVQSSPADSAETKSPPDESEMLSPQWSSPAPGRRSQSPPVEKSPPAERERSLDRRQFQTEAEWRQHFIFSDYYTLLRIFRYLKVKDLARAARVCRMWNDVAVHPSLWKTVRLKDRYEVTDWNGFAGALKRHGTEHLDLRKMLLAAAAASDGIWKKIVSVIPAVTSLVKLELCWCPAFVVKEVNGNCPQLKVSRARRQYFTFTDYPVLLRIFGYLNVLDLLRVARVCRMWRDLAVHPSLWKTVRVKGKCKITNWGRFTNVLVRRGTQHLDLREMLVSKKFQNWMKFVSVIQRVTSIVKLELCRCPVVVIDEVIENCPQLEVLNAMSIKHESVLNLESVGNLRRCQELRLGAMYLMYLKGDLSPLQTLTELTHLSVTSVKDLGNKRIDILELLTNLETLELGGCTNFPEEFGTRVLLKLQNLKRLRLEKGPGSCYTRDILEGVSKLENLSQLELLDFHVTNGFDKCLANCKNIKRLLIVPSYISEFAMTNNMILGGVTELSNNLTHFVWGFTYGMLSIVKKIVNKNIQVKKQAKGNFIPVLEPVPCLELIADIEEEGDNKVLLNLTDPRMDVLRCTQLQKILVTALPKTRFEILKISSHDKLKQRI